MSLLWRHKLAVSIPADYDLDKLPYPLYGSPKGDGVRCGIQCGVAVTRNGLPVTNLAVQERFGRKEFEGLDAELTVGPFNGKDLFNRTVRVTQKRDADAGDVRLNVFDWHGDLPFTDRIGALKAVYGKRTKSGIYIVKQTLIKNASQLLSFESDCLSEGYEGVMLIRADEDGYPNKKGKNGKPTKDNRSTLAEFTLVRLKRFEHAFARITAVHPLEHNLNMDRVAGDRRSSKKEGRVTDAALMGSVSLEGLAPKGNVPSFRASVATKAARNWAGWADEKQWKGKKVRYKYFPIGMMNGVPRFPTVDLKELIP